MHMGRLKGILNVALFLVLVLIKFIRLSTSTARDTIDLNHSIADGDVLVSAGGNYALGFFRPGNSDRRYVGIWFNKVTERTVVWVANRDAPLNDTSGVVSFDGAGNNLVLTTKTNSAPLWSTNATVTDGDVGEISVAAKLLDSGNLVVIQKGTERVLWQSFDYPTDTWLPFMKLGVDRRTGLNRVLTSWNSTDDPGTGSYSYGIDLTGVPQLFLFKGSEPHWRGGPWNGLRWSGTPELHSEFIRNISFVDSPDETTFTHGPLVNGDSVFSKLVLEDSGFAQEFTWHDADKQWFEFWSAPKDHCDSYGRCGANSYCESNSDSNSAEFECHCLPGFKPRSPKDWSLRYGSGGCVRARGPGSACRSGEGFVKVAQVKVPDTRVASVDKGLSGKACEQKCLSDCRCTAYTSANVSDGGNGKGCLVWYGDLIDIKMFSVENEGQDLYVRVDAIELANARKKSSKGFHGAKWIIVTAIVLSISAALLLILFWCCLHRRRSKLRGHARLWSQHSSLLNIFASHKTDLDENDYEGSNNRIELPFFNLREMKSATNNFSNKLGEGGFGAVYKGQLSNGQNIAVKRLSKHSGQGAEEFKNEVQLIAKLQHRNLVKVLGCCVDGEETMLIYEYMPNKSLDVFIFDHSRKALLDWRRRYEIIIGIVQGIIYLHQGSRLRIVHRDLKASNILLDGDMNPKISDFGVARIFGGNQTQASTKRVIGTFGYISPEYALDGLFSTKSDVFSFGVLLLEIITGKKNHALYNDNPLTNLIRHIWDLWNEDKALDIVDSSMGDSWQCSKVLRCIQVGLLCVQETATDRPTMIDVLVMLSSEATLPSPKKPGFTVRRTHGDVAWATGSSACSRNEITITTVEPR